MRSFAATPPPDAYVKYVDTCLMPVRDAGLMDPVSTETQVTHGVTILHTPGHTDGSVSILVQSGDEAAIFIGDLAHLCVQLDEPEWSPAYEMDREESVRSRHRVVQEALGRNALITGAHLDESPIFGRMMMVNNRQSWVGVELPG